MCGHEGSGRLETQKSDRLTPTPTRLVSFQHTHGGTSTRLVFATGSVTVPPFLSFILGTEKFLTHSQELEEKTEKSSTNRICPLTVSPSPPSLNTSTVTQRVTSVVTDSRTALRLCQGREDL